MLRADDSLLRGDRPHSERGKDWWRASQLWLARCEAPAIHSPRAWFRYVDRPDWGCLREGAKSYA